MIKLKRPLACFDLETTGTDTENDRIVEIAITKIYPNATRQSYYALLNPCIPINPEASKVHGITDEEVRDKPRFFDIAGLILDFMEGCDIAGFNQIKFDLPLLIAEFKRIDIDFDVSDKKLVDVMRIFHLYHPRNLAAAYAIYTGKQIDKAHSADADTNATLDVLLAQIERHEGEEVEFNNEKLLFKNDIDFFHKISMGDTVDFDGMLKVKNTQVCFTKGKYKDCAVVDVKRNEPSYIDWLLNKSTFPSQTKNIVKEILNIK